MITFLLQPTTIPALLFHLFLRSAVANLLDLADHLLATAASSLQSGFHPQLLKLLSWAPFNHLLNTYCMYHLLGLQRGQTWFLPCWGTKEEEKEIHTYQCDVLTTNGAIFALGSWGGNTSLRKWHWTDNRETYIVLDSGAGTAYVGVCTFRRNYILPVRDDTLEIYSIGFWVWPGNWSLIFFFIMPAYNVSSMKVESVFFT